MGVNIDTELINVLNSCDSPLYEDIKILGWATVVTFTE